MTWERSITRLSQLPCALPTCAMNDPPVDANNNGGVPTPSRLLEAALDYVGRGWRVIPLHTPTLEGCSCRKASCYSVGKHPRISNGLDGASLDVPMINRWWTMWPDANIGVVTGPHSGVVVLDVDGAVGQASLKTLGPLPETLRANSG